MGGSPAANPWFAIPAKAVATVPCGDRASFAHAFGRLGDPEEAAYVHRRAGLRDVKATLVVSPVSAGGAAEHWSNLVRDNGHFRRIAATIDDHQRMAPMDELEARLGRLRDGDVVRLERTLVLVTGRR